MLGLLAADGSPRIVVVEKTDRLYRNRADALALEELIEKRGIEVHLVKEARVVGKDSRSQDEFMHDIHVAVAKHYVENLRDEVKKGMREKAEQGIYPGRAPIGYRNNSVTRAIDVDPERAPIVKHIFDLYASGEHSLITLRRTMLHEWGIRLSRSYFEKILKNRFYLGYFVWQGVEYKGTHTPLIATELYGRVQGVLAGRHKLKHRKHVFAFAGLLRCAHDGCTVTAELQKRKYVYYRCSHGRGKCPLPYMREQDVSDRLGELLKHIYMPETVAHSIVASLQADSARNEMERQQRMTGLKQRLATLRARMDQMYEDKLDGKIEEGFWARKMNESLEQERQLESDLAGIMTSISPDGILTVQRIFELANKRIFCTLRELKRNVVNC